MTDQKVITLPGLGESLISSFNEVVPPEIRAQIEREQPCESADQTEASAAAAMPHDTGAAQTRQTPPVFPDVLPPPLNQKT